MQNQQTAERPAVAADAILSGYQASYQSAADMYGQFLRGLFDVNAESCRFVARRLEEDFQWPAALAQCRNPVELLEVQGRFLEKMVADYMEEGRRMLDLAGDTARAHAHDLEEAASLGSHAVEEAALAGARMADALESEAGKAVSAAAEQAAEAAAEPAPAPAPKAAPEAATESAPAPKPAPAAAPKAAPAAAPKAPARSARPKAAPKRARPAARRGAPSKE